MNNPNALPAIDSLDALLDRERVVLTTGRLEEIEQIKEQKEKLIDEISQDWADDPDKLENIQSKLTRNRHLLSSALEGIRAVSLRMEALRKAKLCLDTYDEYGQKKRFGTQARTKLEKRA